MSGSVFAAHVAGRNTALIKTCRPILRGVSAAWVGTRERRGRLTPFVKMTTASSTVIVVSVFVAWHFRESLLDSNSFIDAQLIHEGDPIVPSIKSGVQPNIQGFTVS